MDRRQELERKRAQYHKRWTQSRTNGEARHWEARLVQMDNAIYRLEREPLRNLGRTYTGTPAQFIAGQIRGGN